MASTVTPQQTLAAFTTVVGVLEQIAATAVLDIENPLNFLNFSADLALVQNIKTAITDGKTFISDFKAQL